MINLDIFKKNSDEVAKFLLGKELSTVIDFATTGGIIVETESYEGFEDEASHGSIGVTSRNKPLFEEGGIVYVYLNYGMYNLLNIVTGVKNFPSSVFIRAVEPTIGVDIMRRRRGVSNIRDIANGPGKLTIALGIDRTFNYVKVNSSKIFIKDINYPQFEIVCKERIGISKGKDIPRRFYIKGSQWISKK